MTETSITGRDGYIGRQALIYAIACIQNLPERNQEYSNMLDMCALARAMFDPVSLAHAVNGVEHHTETSIDLHFPKGEEQTAEDVVYKLDYQFEQERIQEERSARVKEAVGAVKEKYGIADSAQEVSAKRVADEAIKRAQGRCANT